MAETSEERHPSIVDQPILNSPFEEPKEHWVFEEGLPRREHGRRDAGYWRTKRERVKKVAMTAEEFFHFPKLTRLGVILQNGKEMAIRGRVGSL